MFDDNETFYRVLRNGTVVNGHRHLDQACQIAARGGPKTLLEPDNHTKVRDRHGITVQMVPGDTATDLEQRFIEKRLMS